MTTRITIEAPPAVFHILHTLRSQGHSAELVGGCVRDALLKRQPCDYDIATSALPEAVIGALMVTPLTSVYPTGIKYGTVTAVRGGTPVEITTYRKDAPYSDGRRPDSVEFGTDLTQDVMRRDFTINGLAYDGGQIIDLVEGQHDLERRIIRAIGQPTYRFQEDALRMLRAIRLAAQLNFEIDPYTFSAIKANSNLIHNVSIERIREELNKILLSPNPAMGIGLLLEAGLLREFLPEIQRLKGFDQRNPRHHKDVFGHTLAVVDATPPHLHVRLAALLHDVGKPDTFTQGDDGIGHFYEHHVRGASIAEEILRRLKYNNFAVTKVTTLVREHMTRNPYFRQTGLKRMIQRVGEDNIEDLFDLMIADVVGHKAPFSEDMENVLKLREETIAIRDRTEPMKVTDLAINGKDLIKWGLKPGPLFSKILNRLLDEVIENPDLNTADYLRFQAMTFAASEVACHSA